MIPNESTGNIVKRLEDSIGELVLIYNSPRFSDGRPSLFKISQVDTFRSGDNLIGHIIIRTNSPFYQLTTEHLYEAPTGNFDSDKLHLERNNLHGWGRNFFSEPNAQIAIGTEEAKQALREWGYEGNLPVNIFYDLKE